MTANLGIVNGLTRVDDLSGVTDPLAARANLGVSRWQVGHGSGNVGLPNFIPASQGTVSSGNGTWRAQITPILDPIRVTSAHVVVQTAGGANTLSRLGIYRLQIPRSGVFDDSFVGDLVADFGTVAVSTQGQKDATAAAPFVLQPGLYLFAAATDSASMTYGAQAGFSPVFVHRGTPVSNNWRSFGVFWGGTANSSSAVTTMPSTLTLSTGSTVGSSSTGSVNNQFIFLSWSTL